MMSLPDRAPEERKRGSQSGTGVRGSA